MDIIEVKQLTLRIPHPLLDLMSKLASETCVQLTANMGSEGGSEASIIVQHTPNFVDINIRTDSTPYVVQLEQGILQCLIHKIHTIMVHQDPLPNEEQLNSIQGETSPEEDETESYEQGSNDLSSVILDLQDDNALNKDSIKKKKATLRGANSKDKDYCGLGKRIAHQWTCKLCGKMYCFERRLWIHVKSVHKMDLDVYESVKADAWKSVPQTDLQQRVKEKKSMTDIVDIKTENVDGHIMPNVEKKIYQLRKRCVTENVNLRSKKCVEKKICEASNETIFPQGMTFKNVNNLSKRGKKGGASTTKTKTCSSESVTKGIKNSNDSPCLLQCLLCKESFSEEEFNTILQHLQNAHSDCSDHLNILSKMEDGLIQKQGHHKLMDVPAAVCCYCAVERHGALAMSRHLKLCHSNQVDIQHEEDKITDPYIEKRSLDTKRNTDKHRKFFCKYCNKEYCSRGGRGRHEKFMCIKNPSRRRLFQCVFCSAASDDKEKMELHIAQHRKEKTQYVCDDCGKAYTSDTSLRFHKRKYHGIIKRKPIHYTKCEQCSQQFHSPAHFRRHILSHTDERTVICESCGKSFKCVGDLKKHQKSIHQNHYRYHCTKCGHGVEKLLYLQRHRCERVRRVQKQVESTDDNIIKEPTVSEAELPNEKFAVTEFHEAPPQMQLEPLPSINQYHNDFLVNSTQVSVDQSNICHLDQSKTQQETVHGLLETPMPAVNNGVIDSQIVTESVAESSGRQMENCDSTFTHQGEHYTWAAVSHSYEQDGSVLEPIPNLQHSIHEQNLPSAVDTLSVMPLPGVKSFTKFRPVEHTGGIQQVSNVNPCLPGTFISPMPEPSVFLQTETINVSIATDHITPMTSQLFSTPISQFVGTTTTMD